MQLSSYSAQLTAILRQAKKSLVEYLETPLLNPHQQSPAVAARKK
jgi:hypothetical protein